MSAAIEPGKFIRNWALENDNGPRQHSAFFTSQNYCHSNLEPVTKVPCSEVAARPFYCSWGNFTWLARSFLIHCGI